MRPSLTADNGRYGRLMNSKLISYRLLGTFARGICAPDFTRNIFRYLGILVDASSWIRMVFVRALASAAFLCFIFVIIVKRSDPKMRRVNARRIVALVQYTHSVWNRSVSNYERQPMAKYYSAIMRSFTVSTFRNRTFPYPAIARFINSGPKSGLPLGLPKIPVALTRATNVGSRFQPARHYVKWRLAHSAYRVIFNSSYSRYHVVSIA